MGFARVSDALPRFSALSFTKISAKGLQDDAAPLTDKFVLLAGAYSRPLEDWTPPPGAVWPPPRNCDRCASPAAAARCLCGEAYCSRACQEADWKKHKPTCEDVIGFNKLGVKINQAAWHIVGVGQPTLLQRGGRAYGFASD